MKNNEKYQGCKSFISHFLFVFILMSHKMTLKVIVRVIFNEIMKNILIYLFQYKLLVGQCLLEVIFEFL